MSDTGHAIGSAGIRRVGWRAALALAAVAAVLVVSAARVTAAGGFNAVEGTQFSGTVGTVLIACQSTAPETFDCSTLPSVMGGATIKWGDGVEDTGIGANKGSCTDTSCIYSVPGTHTYVEEGSYTVAYTVPNPHAPAQNNPAKGTSTATVADAALTNPTGATGLTATEGAQATLQLGTFSDANPGATPADFAATIDWGDATNATAATVATAGGGGFSVTGSHTFAHAGLRTVTVHVADEGGSTTVFSTQVTVADAALTATPASGLSSTEGRSASMTLVTFTDADPGAAVSDYTATISWGDGHGTTGSVVARADGTFAVSATHTYYEEGDYSATVHIADSGGATASVRVPIAVHDARLTITTVGLAATAGQRINGRVATFRDANPAATVGDFTATIHWGDGTVVTAGTISPSNSGGFEIDGAHTYSKPGTYRAQISVSDVGGASVSGRVPVVVASAVHGTVKATMTWTFAFTKSATTVQSLQVHSAPRGGTVDLRCSGRGCPFAHKRLAIHAHGRRTLDLAKRFRGSKLHPGAKIVVEISHPNERGRYYGFSIRSGRTPGVKRACLAPASTAPGLGC